MATALSLKMARLSPHSPELEQGARLSGEVADSLNILAFDAAIAATRSTLGSDFTCSAEEIRQHMARAGLAMRRLLRALRRAARISQIDRAELRHAAQNCLACAQMSAEVELLFRPLGYEGNTMPGPRVLPRQQSYDHSGDEMRPD